MTPKSSRDGEARTPFDDAPFTFAPGGVLRREDFSRERLDWLYKRAQELGQDWIVSHEVRDASRAKVMDEIPSGEPVWIFGYGSLMWNPAFHVADTQPATIEGFHRSFCLNLIFGRGSPEKPGLMLGLDQGGACIGLGHKIAPEHVESELEILWMREMIGTTYRPTWVEGVTKAGSIRMLTFVANAESERYLGAQEFEFAAQRIATSEGYLGDNRTYLYNTVLHLDELGIRDGELHELEERVREIAGDTPQA